VGDPQRPAEVADGAGEPPAVERQQPGRCPEIHRVPDGSAERQRRRRPHQRFSNGAAPQPLLELSLSIARSQGARSVELSAAQDLAGLLRDQGKRVEAQDVLAKSMIDQPTGLTLWS
jgi:hypothetical protein